MANNSPLSLREVAEKLGVSERTIVRWIETGKVEVKKNKNRQGHYRFTRDDFLKLKKYAES